MTTKTETPRKADGIMKKRINNQTIIIKVFFNPDSRETFQDKLLRIMLTEKRLE